MDHWTIEVADGGHQSARLWRESHEKSLIEAALTNGAKDWTWIERPWGVLLELAFEDEAEWLRFRATVAVQAALDGAPDPDGVFVYSGRGGSSAANEPRRPRPVLGAGGAELPIPDPDLSNVRMTRRSQFEPPIERTLDQLPNPAGVVARER